MKILLGGIPLGCDNIGDEAIIACVVKMLKESLPGVDLTVATADSASAELLGVSVIPPFGFVGTPVDGFADVGRFCAQLFDLGKNVFDRYGGVEFCHEWFLLKIMVGRGDEADGVSADESSPPFLDKSLRPFGVGRFILFS